MESSDLERWQIKQINETLFPTLNYLARLKKRIHQRRWSPNDPLLKSVEKAFDSLQELSVRLHEMKCPGIPNLGAKPKKGEK